MLTFDRVNYIGSADSPDTGAVYCLLKLVPNSIVFYRVSSLPTVTENFGDAENEGAFLQLFV